MNYKYIEQLIERYFAAETSVAEERILRAFFTEAECNVPSHLQQYTSLFRFVAEESEAPAVLGEEFDEKLIARLRAKGDMPEVHVRAIKMTLGARLRPLWRAAAAVTLLVAIAGTAEEAIDKTTSIPMNLQAVEATHGVDSTDATHSPYRQVQEGLKMAITNDTLPQVSTRP